MRAARIAVLLVAACRPSSPPASDAGASARSTSCGDVWLAQRDLNHFGDPNGTVYAGGTPLFDERTGRSTDRMEHLLRKHPQLQQACPEEALKAHAP